MVGLILGGTAFTAQAFVASGPMHASEAGGFAFAAPSVSEQAPVTHPMPMGALDCLLGEPACEATDGDGNAVIRCEQWSCMAPAESALGARDGSTAGSTTVSAARSVRRRGLVTFGPGSPSAARAGS